MAREKEAREEACARGNISAGEERVERTLDGRFVCTMVPRLIQFWNVTIMFVHAARGRDALARSWIGECPGTQTVSAMSAIRFRWKNGAKPTSNLRAAVLACEGTD